MTAQSLKSTRRYSVEDIRDNPYLLKHMPAELQTPEICLDAVVVDGLLLEHVKHQTFEICEAAIKADPAALRYVDASFRTSEICLAVVSLDGEQLQHVTQQTDEICLAAVQQTGFALRHVQMQKDGLCLAAVRQKGEVLEFVKHQTPAICLAAVQSSGFALQYVKRQTPEICLAAVAENGLALRWVNEQTLDICLAALRDDSRALPHVHLRRDLMAMPGSGQLDAWHQVLQACVEVDRMGHIFTLVPLIKSVPLGKQHLNEWSQTDTSGVPLIQRLMDVANEVTRLAPNEPETAAFVHRVNQQQEWLLSQQIKSRVSASYENKYPVEKDLPL